MSLSGRAEPLNVEPNSDNWRMRWRRAEGRQRARGRGTIGGPTILALANGFRPNILAGCGAADKVKSGRRVLRNGF